MSTYTSYLTAAARYHRQHPSQRKGQACINALLFEYPGLANKYWGSMLDPFGDDERLPAFLEVIAQELEEAA